MIATLAKVVELATKLEATLTAVALGSQKIHNKLEDMHLEIQIPCNDKGKEACAEIWCMKCKDSRHHKD